MRIKWFVLIAMVFTVGCAHVLDPRIFVAEANRVLRKKDGRILDEEARQGRVRYRNRLVIPLGDDEILLKVYEDPNVEIIDEKGYKNGLECIFINDSRYHLLVNIVDPRGHQFSFWLDPLKQVIDSNTRERRFVRGTKVIKLEIGSHHVQAYREWDTRPWVSVVMRVHSDKVFHPPGLGDYFGGSRFFGS